MDGAQRNFPYYSQVPSFQLASGAPGVNAAQAEPDEKRVFQQLPFGGTRRVRIVFDQPIGVTLESPSKGDGSRS